MIKHDIGLQLSFVISVRHSTVTVLPLASHSGADTSSSLPISELNCGLRYRRLTPTKSFSSNIPVLHQALSLSKSYADFSNVPFLDADFGLLRYNGCYRVEFSIIFIYNQDTNPLQLKHLQLRHFSCHHEQARLVLYPLGKVGIVLNFRNTLKSIKSNLCKWRGLSLLGKI